MNQPAEETRDLLALVPAYNEAERVAQVVEGALRYLPVLVVDDGSRDGTAEVAQGAGAQVVRQTPNQGKGVALQNGFRHALDMGYQAVVTLDADMQHDPDEIPKFLEVYRKGDADLVIGERNYQMIPIVRRFSNTIGRASFSWALGQYVSDNQSGYRLLSRRMMEATLESKERHWQFEVEMIVTCVLRGYKLVWVPIKTIYAGERSHISPINHIYNFFRIVYLTRRRVLEAQRERG